MRSEKREPNQFQMPTRFSGPISKFRWVSLVERSKALMEARKIDPLLGVSSEERAALVKALLSLKDSPSLPLQILYVPRRSESFNWPNHSRGRHMINTRCQTGRNVSHTFDGGSPFPGCRSGKRQVAGHNNYSFELGVKKQGWRIRKHKDEPWSSPPCSAAS